MTVEKRICPHCQCVSARHQMDSEEEHTWHWYDTCYKCDKGSEEWEPYVSEWLLMTNVPKDRNILVYHKNLRHIILHWNDLLELLCDVNFYRYSVHDESLLGWQELPPFEEGAE